MSKSTYTRKATFKEGKRQKGERTFVAVNKRAKAVCKRAGKRTVLTESVLKSFEGKGTYTFHVWNSRKQLKPIRF